MSQEPLLMLLAALVLSFVTWNKGARLSEERLQVSQLTPCLLLFCSLSSDCIGEEQKCPWSLHLPIFLAISFAAGIFNSSVLFSKEGGLESYFSGYDCQNPSQPLGVKVLDLDSNFSKLQRRGLCAQTCVWTQSCSTLLLMA